MFVTRQPVRVNAASNETIRVKLPPNDRDKVATACTVPPIPTTALKRNAVDECHTDASVALPPNRTPALRSHVPALLPTNVTLVEAVEATFVRTAIDTDTVSNVMADVKLPDEESAVIETVAVVPNPEPHFEVKLVIVTQTVDCIALPPTRADAVPYLGPRLRPTSVTLVDAVVATFVRGAPVNVGRSNVIISLRVPVNPTSPVARIRRDAPLPTLCLNTIDVDECHADDCAALPPTRPFAETSNVPALLPTIVTEVEPVIAPFVIAAEDNVRASNVNAAAIVALTRPQLAVINTAADSVLPLETLHRRDVVEKNKLASGAVPSTRRSFE